MTAPNIPDALLRYLSARDQQHAEEITQTLAAMTKREQLLVREAAVMGYVRGQMAGRAVGSLLAPEKIPADSAILFDVVGACLAFGDRYRTMARLARIARRRAAGQQPADLGTDAAPSTSGTVTP